MKQLVTLERHTWKTLCHQIKTICPEFAAIVNSLSPADDYALYVARYPYGAKIVDKGIFSILQNHNISSRIKEDLSYNGSLPVGLITQNTLESFVETENRIIPAALFHPGRFISLWRVLDDGLSYQEGNFWNVSSGARTLCMLPKITDKNGYRRLKNKYGLTLPLPRKLTDHWQMFVELAKQKSFSEEWFCEIIFFSKKWFTHKQDLRWREFYYFLLNRVWQGSTFKRNQAIFDFLFSVIQEKKNLKPNPYLADTVKYLIAIGNGAQPAFTPAINSVAAPVRGLQEIFIEDYGLKKYAPIIMHTHHFTSKEHRPVYYSLQMPTTMIFSPKSTQAASTMMELQELKDIMEELLVEMRLGKLGIEKTPLFEFSSRIQYGYYHSDKDKFGEIAPSTKIETIDKLFTQSLVSDNQYSFPEFSPFFRGCVSIFNRQD